MTTKSYKLLIKIKNESLKKAEQLFDANININEIQIRCSVIKLCFDLLPEARKKLILNSIDNADSVDHVIEFFMTVEREKYIYNVAASFFSGNYRRELKILNPKFENEDYLRNSREYNDIRDEHNYFFEQWKLQDEKRRTAVSRINCPCTEIKTIQNLKKSKNFTEALFATIMNLAFNGENEYHFVADLFLEMNAINSALELYKIDNGIFKDATLLSLLIDKSINNGDLDTSIKLLSDFTNQEPYHPSIPVFQSKIKQIELREYLKTTCAIDFSKINELSGIEFENLVMDKFLELGFKVNSTPKSGDYGADLIIENSEGTRIVVQCKRFKSKVNLKSVQEVVGAMGHYAGDLGLVITNNSFLISAVKLAESNDIELWSGNELTCFLAGDLSFSKTLVAMG